MLLEQMPAQQYPHLAELMIEHAMKPGYNFGDGFEYGLALIIDGLVRERER